MITKEDLLKAGYKVYKGPSELGKELVYQKPVQLISKKKLYCLEVHFWEISNIWSVEYEAQLYLPENNPLVGNLGFTLKMRVDSSRASVSEVEAFYYQAFEALGCVADLHIND